MGTENERPGNRFYCGKFGCIETFLSGTGLAREYFLLSQKESKAEQIAVAEKAGDPYAVRSFATYKDRLARSLAALANDVIGGGISNINSLYDELPELIGRHALSDGIRTRVVRAAHGNSSGVRGAAWLWPIEKTQKMVIHTRRSSGSRSTLQNLLPRLRAAANSS